MNLLDLYATIFINSDDYERGLDDAVSSADSFGSKVGESLRRTAQVIGAGVAAASKAITTLTKYCIENYGEYEQLVGGVETLFKDSADKVRAYADNAYQTAGLSANDYMSTVSSFSASLLQSLDGDTAKAAEYADQAIIDMADNANKMGTSIDMIQNAYQGFAKQNYTMLDNLNTMGALAA